jgi:hypothetical protein
LVNFDPTTYFLRDLKVKVLLLISWKYVHPFGLKFDTFYLQCEFSKTFKLWYGSIGGDAVGLTWENPKVLVTAWAIEHFFSFVSAQKEKIPFTLNTTQTCDKQYFYRFSQ